MSPQRKSTRRQFLKGQPALDAFDDLAHQQTQSPSPQDVSAGQESAFLMHVSRRAMACEFEIFFSAERGSETLEVAADALELVDSLEGQLSVFREQSEISLINRNAAQETIRVETQLFELLSQAELFYQQTEGAFDITTGALSKTWGFVRRQGRFPSDEELDEALQKVGFDLVVLDPKEKTIHFQIDSLEINLGAIGKGYALDRCGQHLEQAGVDSFLIHGGQSSVLACGARHASDRSGGWLVALRHPIRQEQRLGQLRLCDQALGTSGSGNQFFTHQGRRYGHILDPRTGRPAEGVLSATVIAPTAAMADALATAFYVMGVDRSIEYCQQHDSLAAVFVLPGERSGAVELKTIGLDEHRWIADPPL